MVLFPEVQAQLQAAITQAARGEKVRYDVQVRLGPEKFVTIDFALVPLLDAAGQVEYLIPSGIDISDRLQSQRFLWESQIQLKQQLAEIEAIYQSAPVGLTVLDHNLRFLRINERLAEINGQSVEAHLGRSVRELLPELADTVEAFFAQLLKPENPNSMSKFAAKPPLNLV
ncbi:MAG: PAS domain-containing protein [Chloroflexaceae bacterium]|nr:PAS domain-containing protein [Chloroflexaceae bacterium]